MNILVEFDQVHMFPPRPAARTSCARRLPFTSPSEVQYRIAINAMYWGLRLTVDTLCTFLTIQNFVSPGTVDEACYYQRIGIGRSSECKSSRRHTSSCVWNRGTSPTHICPRPSALMCASLWDDLNDSVRSSLDFRWNFRDHFPYCRGRSWEILS